jgi:ribosomal protein S18 acetylase RimI-like enzyme
MEIALRPANSLTLAALAELFTAAYAGYVLPFAIDEPTLRFMVDAFDIDLAASRVAFRDDEPVGHANLALRVDEAWIGGIGVVPSARRQGVAETLMGALHEEARARGVTQVWLEVIEQNESAFRLYEKLGYEVVREVEVWALAEDSTPGSAREVPAAEAHARIRKVRTGREPWQRDDRTLENHNGLRGLETDAGAAVVKVSGRVQLVQIAGSDPHELLRTARTLGAVVALNFPADDPVVAAVRDLGGTLTVRQREMVLRL